MEKTDLYSRLAKKYGLDRRYVKEQCFMLAYGTPRYRDEGDLEELMEKTLQLLGHKPLEETNDR